MRVVIVGGVAGGASAASRLRRLDEHAEIIILERDEYVSYANCGLPYYIGEVIKSKGALLVQTVEGLKSRFNIDARVKNEVIAVDKVKKVVTVVDHNKNEEYELPYDKLILSTGAKPIKPNIKGIKDATNVFKLRNVGDTYRIKDFVDEKGINNAVVVGGGFIGVEIAENLAHIGKSVTIVEKLNQVISPLDFEMAQILHAELNRNGVDLVLEDGVSEIKDGGKKVVLESGKELDADIIVLAIGVTPENTLAKSADLRLGPRGHVITKENFKAIGADGSVEKDIYAVGDMIEVINPLDDSNYAVPLAWGANRQGKLVADDICGIKFKPVKIQGSSVLKVFDLIAASTGANEKVLKQKNINYQEIYSYRSNHAGYYPGSSVISMKLLYEKGTGRILGAQAIGKEGTEKRIDVISTAMRLGGTVFDLSDLELCYAPPVSSAKDPVNIMGYIAENIENGLIKPASVYDIDKIIADGGYVLDVRTKAENDARKIEGSINIEVDKLRENLDKLPSDKNTPIYVLCAVGLRAYVANRILEANGYKNTYNVLGGYTTYANLKYKVGSGTLKPPAVCKSGGDMQSSADIKNTVVVNKDIQELDCSGLQCPGPIMATFKKMESMKPGEVVRVTATEGGFLMDIENWTKTNGHTLKGLVSEGGKYIATIEKGGGTGLNLSGVSLQENATLVLFSGNLDKALAAMIIAQGAAAQGKKVTIFFTFWGLNALRKENKVKVKKGFIGQMFGKMMPRGASKLPLSNMNMAGMGRAMIKSIMKKNNVDDIATMIEATKAAGVKMIACMMSMDLMGIKKEELIDGVEYAGVATYISANENVGTTLFI
jgi:NADPH-dependent 2,4-dienoyl-CoA reductase/sulfur reductase-like enzyme/peroxiredoxin family protein/TusA-related sulfurtransferase/rhodanese-related sulfurtransferase